ncbi:MAG TPA: hypothetical protein VGS23_05870, partial [Thermoplasmata archaeon]|nr:hypothetical protein [Thermoplasmata archaeon]
VNARRRELRLPPVEIVLVPRVVGEDLRPIEGRRIRAGEIDPAGRRLTPVRVRVRTNDPSVSEAVRRALGAAFGRVPLAVRFEKATSNRPRGTEGPGTAVRWARPASSGTDLGIGLVRRRDGSLLVAAAIPEGPQGAFRLTARAASELDRRLERLLRAHAPQRGDRARTAHRIATR